jgi:predicted nucleic acid-binding Zn ribbon protein
MAALFFSQRKPRGFNYKPRYYDPEAEEREHRKRVVLGEKYRSPAERARDAAKAAEARATEANATGETGPTQSGTEGGTQGASDPGYVPGSFLREHIASRRGVHAADSMRRRRRKTHSIPVLVGMLVVIVLIVWMLYFK